MVRKLDIPVKIDFIVTSSYGYETETSGTVEITSHIEEDLTGYHVLIVDDIVDSGLTMKKVIDHLKAKIRPVKKRVLLDKRNADS